MDRRDKLKIERSGKNDMKFQVTSNKSSKKAWRQNLENLDERKTRLKNNQFLKVSNLASILTMVVKMDMEPSKHYVGALNADQEICGDHLATKGTNQEGLHCV